MDVVWVMPLQSLPLLWVAVHADPLTVTMMGGSKPGVSTQV